MSPAEYMEAMTSLYNSGYTALALFLTVLSGYMIVAYTVGKELRFPQVIFISILFVAFSMVFATGSYSWILAAVDFAETHGDGASQFLRISAPFMLAIQDLAILGALLFMRDIRKFKD